MRLNNWNLLRHLTTSNSLDVYELRVAIQILSFRNQFTLQCNPSQRILASKMSLTQKRFSRLVGSLRRKGVLDTIQTVNTNNLKKGSLQYYFLWDIEKAKEIAEGIEFKGSWDNWEAFRIKNSS